MTITAQIPIKKPISYFLRYWRPAMAWQYLFVCLFDFVFAPILWTGFHGWLGLPLSQWQPLTLQNGGMYHMAMGAIIGVATWQRTNEKIEMMKKISTDLIHNDPEKINEDNINPKPPSK